MNTLVVQSYKSQFPNWLRKCQDSVRTWTEKHNYDYNFIDDAIFSLNPDWFNDKLKHRLPIKSDLARLLYIKNHLLKYERVVWFDIDTFIFAPDLFSLSDTPYLFGEERWIQPHKNSWRIYKNACNAFCQFQRGNAFLEFYIDTALRIISDVDPNHIAPQLIGPKLLTALHGAITLPLTPAVGSASPWLIQTCAQNNDRLINRIAHTLTHTPCVALNMCASLAETEDALERCMVFLQHFYTSGITSKV